MITYKEMPPEAKTWIYQSNKEFTPKETREIRKQIKEFMDKWTNHDKKLKGFGNVYHNYFIVLMADVDPEEIGGCSIDASVHFIKDLEKQYGLNLFDRLVIAYRNKDNIFTAHQESFIELINNGSINEDTIVFNNLASSKETFERDWEVPFNKSWHKALMS